MAERLEKILTVTVPSYNVERFLAHTVQTMLAPEILGALEILIVNDGSMDGTAKIGSRLEREYPGTVRLIEKENGGHGSAINRGIMEATGRYFRVVDGDDWVDTGAFSAFVDALRDLDSDVVMTPYCRVWEGSMEVTEVPLPGPLDGQVHPFEPMLNFLGNQYTMHCLTFRTSLLKRMRPIDEHCFYVDMEYILYPLKMLNTVACLPYPVYRYRVGQDEQSVSKKNYIKNRAMHQRVFTSLLRFYEEEKDLGEEKRHYLKFRLGSLATRQLEIYFSMKNDKETRAEAKEFLAFVRKEAKPIYEEMPGKKAKLLRLFGPDAFGWISFFYRKDKRG